MEYTLWRGEVFLGSADLQQSKRPGVLRGPIQRTVDLERLGPISQARFRESVFQHALPRASEWMRGGSVGSDLDVVEVWESDSEPSAPAPVPLPREQLLTVRSADGKEVPMDMISVIEPPELPAAVVEQMDAATRERLAQWRVTCRLSAGDSDAA